MILSDELFLFLIKVDKLVGNLLIKCLMQFFDIRLNLKFELLIGTYKNNHANVSLIFLKCY